MARSSAQWREQYRACGSTHALAAFILRDLTGYRKNAAHRDEDVDNLAAALDMILNRGHAMGLAEQGDALLRFLRAFRRIGARATTINHAPPREPGGDVGRLIEMHEYGPGTNPTARYAMYEADGGFRVEQEPLS